MDGHTRIFAICSLVCVLVACGKKEDEGPTRWHSFPVAIYADAGAVTSQADAADLADAMSFWEQRAGKKLFDYKGIWSGGAPYSGDPGHPSAILANVIFVQNPWSFAALAAAETIVISAEAKIEGSLIAVNPSIPFCNGDCRGDWRASQRRVFTHELGHFLGLPHVEDSANIMYPNLLPGGTIAEFSVDQRDLSDRTR